MATVTHKTFVVDPRVHAHVTMRSSAPLTPTAMYEAFLSTLWVHGFVAVPGGAETVKIAPDAIQRFDAGTEDRQDRRSTTSDEVVTQVIPIKNVSAVRVAKMLRSMVPTTGQINGYSQANMIIISDHASNVNRLMKIIAHIDQVGDLTSVDGNARDR